MQPMLVVTLGLLLGAGEAMSSTRCYMLGALTLFAAACSQGPGRSVFCSSFTSTNGMTCTIFSDLTSSQHDDLTSACMVGGGIPQASCPAAPNLIGCCRTRGTGGVQVERCNYGATAPADAGAMDENTCSSMGGTWTTTQ